MKILFFSTSMLSTGYFSIDIELALKHLNKNHEVHFLVCNDSLTVCEFNQRFEKKLCVLCKKVASSAFKNICIPQSNIHDIRLNDFFEDFDLPSFEDIDDLKNYQKSNVDIGSTIASTLITIANDSKPSMKKNADYVNKGLRVSYAIYQSVSFYLKRLKPDLFYLFNGRTITRRPALRAAQKLGVETYVIEKYGVKEKYSLTKNNYPHSLESTKKEIDYFWDTTTNINLKKVISKGWFMKQNKLSTDLNFSKITHNNFELNTISKNKTNIVIFNSSEDEMESIGKWKETIYKNQSEAIVKILEDFIDDDSYHFYLRVHPRLKDFDNTQVREINSLDYKNLTVIRANESLNSYDLIKKTEIVITFGSTIGLEAVFIGKPVILLGRAFYEGLDCFYKPNSHSDLIKLLKLNLKPLKNDNLYKYGYWQEKRGHYFDYINYDNYIWEGYFLGFNLEGVKFYDVFGLKKGEFSLLTTKINLVSFLKQIICKGNWLDSYKSKIQQNILNLELEIKNLRSRLPIKISTNIIFETDSNYVEPLLINIMSFSYKINIFYKNLSEETIKKLSSYANIFFVEESKSKKDLKNKILDLDPNCDWSLILNQDEFFQGAEYIFESLKINTSVYYLNIENIKVSSSLGLYNYQPYFFNKRKNIHFIDSEINELSLNKTNIKVDYLNNIFILLDLEKYNTESLTTKINTLESSYKNNLFSIEKIIYLQYLKKENDLSLKYALFLQVLNSRQVNIDLPFFNHLNLIKLLIKTDNYFKCLKFIEKLKNSYNFLDLLYYQNFCFFKLNKPDKRTLNIYLDLLKKINLGSEDFFDKNLVDYIKVEIIRYYFQINNILRSKAFINQLLNSSSSFIEKNLIFAQYYFLNNNKKVAFTYLNEILSNEDKDIESNKDYLELLSSYITSKMNKKQI